MYSDVFTMGVSSVHQEYTTIAVSPGEEQQLWVQVTSQAESRKNTILLSTEQTIMQRRNPTIIEPTKASAARMGLVQARGVSVCVEGADVCSICLDDVDPNVAVLSQKAGGEVVQACSTRGNCEDACVLVKSGILKCISLN